MATLIRPNSRTEEVFPGNNKKFTLEEVQRLVGGDVQLLEVTPGIYGEIKVTARGTRQNVCRSGGETARPTFQSGGYSDLRSFSA